MDEKWKQITDIKEIGNQTDKIETTEFPDEPVIRATNEEDRNILLSALKKGIAY